jgi:hypothetical protein
LLCSIVEKVKLYTFTCSFNVLHENTHLVHLEQKYQHDLLPSTLLFRVKTLSSLNSTTVLCFSNAWGLIPLLFWGNDYIQILNTSFPSFLSLGELVI